MPYKNEQLTLIKKSIDDFIYREFPEEYAMSLENSAFSCSDGDNALHSRISPLLKRILSADGLGVAVLAAPPEFGGMAGALPGLIYAGEALGRADLGIATGALASLLAGAPVFSGGTEEQRRGIAGRILRGEIGAFAATEPQGGSSVAELRTQALPVSGGEYVLNGAKQWITNAGIADFYIILAKTPEGPAWFIADKSLQGLSFGLPEKKYGQHLSVTADLYLDNVNIPAENMVGLLPGQGLRQASAAFDLTRLIVASMSAGSGEAALETAALYSLSRYGGALSEDTAYMNGLIVPHYVRLEAVRFYLESLCRLSFTESDSGIYAQASSLTAESSISKFFAAEACVEACRASSQACGGAGISREYSAGKRLSDSLILPIYEGADEILKISVFRKRWQDYLRSGGKLWQQKAEAAASFSKDACSGMAAQPMILLSSLFEICRKHRLNRDRHISLKFGEFIAYSEIASSFFLCASSETAKAMSRIFAREALSKIYSGGLAAVSGLSSEAGHEFCVKMSGFQLKLAELFAGNAEDCALAAKEILKKAGKSGKQEREGEKCK